MTATLTDLRAIGATLNHMRRVVIMTGAGISAGSGIPTYRSGDGLWHNHNPADVGSFDAWLDNPSLVNAFYLHRIATMRGALPNAAHIAVEQIRSTHPHVDVITTNVDDLHERAGTRAIHVHGDLFRPYCTDCGTCYDALTYYGDAYLDRILDEKPEWVTPRSCANRWCDGVLRPGVVMFGDGLKSHAWEQAVDAIFDAEAVLVIGAGLTVTPSKHLPFAALGDGIPVFEINPESTDLTALATTSVQSAAEDVLPELAHYVSSRQHGTVVS